MSNRREDAKTLIGQADSLLPAFGRDAFAYAIASIIPAALNVLKVSIFTRVFSPSDFGRYSLAFTTVGICTVLLSAWVQQSILRFRPGYVESGSRRGFDRNLLFLLVGLSVMVVAAGAVGWPLVGPWLHAYRGFYWIGVGLVVSGVWYGSLGVLLQADLRAREYSTFATVQAVLRLLLSLGWVFLIVRDVRGLLWGVLLAQTLMIVPMARALGLHRVRQVVKTGTASLGRFAAQFARYGMPMLGWAMSAELLDLSDRYLLQFFHGSAQVGIYSPIYGIGRSIIGLVTGPLITAAHALLMKAAGKSEKLDKDRLQDTVSSLSRIFLAVAIPASVYMVVFGREIVTVFLGPEYRQGYMVLPLAVVGFLAWRFAMYGHKGFEFLGKTRKMFVYVLVCAVFNILLNLFFVPRYGYLGAAMTTSISSLLYPVLVYFGSRREFRWRIPWASMGRIALCGLIAAGGSWIVKRVLGGVPNFVLLLVGFFAVSLVYILLLFVLREVTWEEIRSLGQSILARRGRK